MHRRHFIRALLAGAAVVSLPVHAGVIKYVCPMHPQIVRDHPGTCPICGMKLVQKVFEQEAGSPSVKLGTQQAQGEHQGFAVRTARVKRTTLWKYLPTYGVIEADADRLVHIHPRAKGWIEQLAVHAEGEAVKKGQLLYRYYAPDIVAAQEEWLLALKQGRTQLARGAQRKLHYLGLDQATLKQVRKRGRVLSQIPVYAPISGVVQQLKVQQGMFITPATELMQLADLSRVWVRAQVYPQQRQWVALDKSVEVHVPGYPNRYWEGLVDYIYPELHPVTRTLQVRTTLPNEDGALKLGDPVRVIIYGGPKRNVLAVPESALIELPDEIRVVKVLPGGGFKPVPVQVGMRTRGVAEIVSGLKEGDEIVTSGQFLIDSESQMRANLQKLAAPQQENGQ